MKRHIKKFQSNAHEFEGVTHLHIVDWTEIRDKLKTLVPDKVGGCDIYEKGNVPKLKDGMLPQTVEISFTEKSDVFASGFRPCAWNPKQGVKQCDAIVFLSSDEENHEVVLVETKYANVNNWSQYKKIAPQQIIDTVSELKIAGAPVDKRNLIGLVAFPCLRVETFGGTFFSKQELRNYYEHTRIRFLADNKISMPVFK